MAIYKLGDICTSIRGNCSFQKKDIIDEESDHSYVALHYGKTYKVSVVDNSFSYYVSNDFYKENQIVRKHDTVLVSTSETLDDLGHSYLYNRDDFGLLGGEQILLQANENIIIKKYLYYLSLGLKQQLKTYATGLKVYRFKKEDFRNINVVVPSIKEQQAIIDIIKPVEELFLKYSNLIRIDTVDNCKKDVSNLIDIIEPLEQCIHNVQKQIKVLKRILVIQYKLNNDELVSFVDYITLCSFKFNGQKGYLATNAISEFSIDYSKLQNIEVTDRPSRANLTPEANSLIISKLDGENKAYYIDESFPYVVSTGFFNFTTKYLDHITGFILSDSFKEQKSIFSTGTTMIGLNNDSLFKIKMVKPSISSNTCTLKLNSLLKVEQELYSTLSILIKLLIK